MRKIKVIGLTGQTGAGKSTVSKIISAQGVEVIDCDLVSREVVANEKRCVADLALEFSISVLNIDGTLNRKKLGSIVFSDKEKLEKLNDIIFPYIREYLHDKIAELDKKGVNLVVLDAPTLFESGMDCECDSVVSVIAPETQRLNRIVIRDHLTEEEARNRSDSQHDDEFYTSRSQLVIVNDGDEHELHVKALELVCALQRAANDAAQQ